MSGREIMHSMVVPKVSIAAYPESAPQHSAIAGALAAVETPVEIISAAASSMPIGTPADRTSSSSPIVSSGDKSSLYDAVFRTDIDHMGTVEKIYLVNLFNTEIEKSNHILKAGKTLLECLVNLKVAAANCDQQALVDTKVKYIDAGNYKVELASSGGSMKNFVEDALDHLTLTDQDHWELGIFNKIVNTVHGYWQDTTATVTSAQSVKTTVTSI